MEFEYKVYVISITDVHKCDMLIKAKNVRDFFITFFSHEHKKRLLMFENVKYIIDEYMRI